MQVCVQRTWYRPESSTAPHIILVCDADECGCTRRGQRTTTLRQFTSARSWLAGLQTGNSSPASLQKDWDFIWTSHLDLVPGIQIQVFILTSFIHSAISPVLPLNLLRQPLTEFRTHQLASRATLTPGILLSLPSQEWDYKHTMLHRTFYIHAGNLSSGPHACMERTLPTKPYPQSINQWFPTFLMLYPFNTVPYVLVTPNHEII